MKESRDQIEKEVIKAIAEILRLDEERVKPELLLVENLGIDSFMVVELIFELEDKYDLEIPDDDVIKLKKVEDIVDYIGDRVLKN